MTASTEVLVPAAMEAWSSFADLLQQMSEVAATAKQQREQSLQARKALADTTKQFKRSVKNAESAAQSLSSSSSSSNNTNSESTNDPILTSLTVASVEALSKECRVTIKAYQEEVDNLTRRCKTAETSYSTAVTALAELPDPAQALEAAWKEILEQKQQLQQVLNTKRLQE